MSQLDHLRESLQQSLGGTWEMPAVPKELDRQIAKLRKTLGDGGGIAPTKDRMQEAISHFWQYGRFSGLPEARLICFGAIERFVPQRPALIDDASAFPRLLEQVDEYSLDPRPFRRCYRGLVHCYFTYDPDTQEAAAAGVRNWERLQRYLDDRYDSVRLHGYEPEWVTVLAEHRNLLTPSPVKPYAAAALKGDTDDFKRACQAIEIAETSWLIRRLVLAQVEFATEQSDDRFKPYVLPLLGVLDEYPMVKHLGLAQLVNRYATSNLKEEHKALRDAALGAWGNPLLNGNRPKWGHVSEEGRRMVANWLKLDLIQNFFEILSDDRDTDPRRVEFWKRYHEQMHGMFFALGSKARYSRSPDIRSLREKMGDLRLSLVHGGVAANNAFIMLMGDYAVVEFGVTGNACYIFQGSRLPFELRGDIAGDRTGLKDDSKKEWLRHVDTSSGPWEEEFSRVLSRLGIRRSDGAAPERTRARSVQQTNRVEVIPDPPPSRVPFTRQALRQFVGDHGLTISDKTSVGGTLFVYHDKPSGDIADQLKRWGFKFGPIKRAWYRKGWL